jgi:DNA-binding GntR family transcriptional regulator
MATKDAKPLAKTSLEEQATDLIRQRIIQGDIPLGTRVVESALAEHYGISRGTIRVALRRLADEGLIHQVPYAGYEVIEFTEHDLWEILTLRRTLESLAAYLAAQSITPEGRRALREAFEALREAAARDNRVDANLRDHELHLMISQLSGNGRLERFYRRIENQFRSYIALSNSGMTPGQIAESHRDLVEAICAGDADRAQRVAAENVSGPAAELSAPEPTQGTCNGGDQT